MNQRELANTPLNPTSLRSAGYWHVGHMTKRETRMTVHSATDRPKLTVVLTRIGPPVAMRPMLFGARDPSMRVPVAKSTCGRLRHGANLRRQYAGKLTAEE